MNKLQINKLEDSAAGRAMAAVSAASGTLNQFSDFTSDLVRDVFKVVIDSTLEQLEAYADIVAKVSGSVAEYEQRTLGSGAEQTRKALEFASQVVLASFGKGSPKPVLVPGDEAVATLVEFEASTVAELRAGFGGLEASITITELPATAAAKVDDPAYVAPTGVGTAKVAFDAVLEVDSATTPTTWKMKKKHLVAFALARLKRDVQASYDKLITVLKLGMQKLVVTEGEIATSVTFHVDSADTDELTSNTTTTDADERSRGFSGSLAARGGRSFSDSLGKSILSRSLGGSVNLGYSSSRVQTKLKVNVVNEKQTAVTNLSVDITGAVKIKFRSDYFPSVDPSTALPPAGA